MSTWRSPRPAGSTFGMVVIPTIWLADNSVQVASDGPSAPTKGGARREATGRKRSPTSYGERTIARARWAKAQELVDRLVAEERSVLPTLMTTRSQNGGASLIKRSGTVWNRKEDASRRRAGACQ